MHLCQPRIVTTEGADHTGVDAFFKCRSCERRTTNHVECERITEGVRAILRREWAAGRTTPPKGDR